MWARTDDIVVEEEERHTFGEKTDSFGIHPCHARAPHHPPPSPPSPVAIAIVAHVREVAGARRVWAERENTRATRTMKNAAHI
jgi:hypothetical protein